VDAQPVSRIQYGKPLDHGLSVQLEEIGRNECEALRITDICEQ